MLTYSLVLLSCSLVSVSCQHAEWAREFVDWQKLYSKQYSSPQEEAAAQRIWLRNKQFVDSHPADATFTVGLNQFSDQEWNPSWRVQSTFVPSSHKQLRNLPPAHFDWRDHGVISPVQNQGVLGASDVIAITEDLESLHAIKSSQLVGLSIQEVSDCCDPIPHLMIQAPYECIAKLGGLCSASAYPPNSSSQQCKSQQCQAVAKDANHTAHIAQGDETSMLSAILTRPLVVYLDASQASFQLYRAGVYSEARCSSQEVDHAVQVVGYGQQGAQKFWILKNSWGESWGLKGYMLIRRGVNMCGLANFAIYPH